MTPILEREVIEELVPVMGNDMAEFIGTFIAYSAELLGQMSAHAEKGDLGSLIMVVHSFKGSSRNIGATVLADRLSELEATLRQAGMVGIDPAFGAVQADYEDVCTALQQYL